MGPRFLPIGAVLIALSTPAKADTIRNFQVGSWFAGAYTAKGTNTFSHCAASASYRSGILVLFSVNRAYSWSLGFANPAWNLTKGSRYNIVFVIDDGQPMTGVATAIGPNSVEVVLADSAALFAQFRRVRQLRVVLADSATLFTRGRQRDVAAASQVFSFNLDGTSTLLPALLSCVQQELAGGANPFVSRAAPPTSTQSGGSRADPSYQAEATVILANVLASAQLPGFSIEPAEEAAKFKTDALWTATDVIGMLKVAPGVQLSDPKLASALIGGDAENCKGAFLSGSLPETSGKKSVRMFTGCEQEKGVITAYYLAVQRPKGGIYLFTTVSKAAQETVKQADEGLRRAVLQTIK